MSAHSGGYRRRKRDANEPAIVKALKDAGRQWIPWEARVPGMPDGMAVWPGGFCVMEFKVPKTGVLSPEQRKWHASYRGPKGTLVVPRTPAEALRATGVRT